MENIQKNICHISKLLEDKNMEISLLSDEIFWLRVKSDALLERETVKKGQLESLKEYNRFLKEQTQCLVFKLLLLNHKYRLEAFNARYVCTV